jgi:hypothetical protein
MDLSSKETAEIQAGEALQTFNRTPKKILNRCGLEVDYIELLRFLTQAFLLAYHLHCPLNTNQYSEIVG